MKKQEIPIMFCFDNNYVIPAAVAFYSLLEHCNKNYYYKMYVLHTDITTENQEKLRENIKEFSDFSELIFVDMDNKFEDLWETISTKGHFSKEVMYKILVASIFPIYEKIIVSDVDVVFLNDISESYFAIDPSEDCYLAGVKMIGKMKWYLDQLEGQFSKEEIEKLSGFCGGYIVFNLRKLREDKMEDKFVECFIKDGDRINQMEQDVLNLCCYPKTKLLPLKYIACSYMWDIYKTDADKESDIYYTKEQIDDAMTNTVQLHYATSKKPWKNVDCAKSDVWFRYLLKTNFAEEYFATLPNKIIIPEDRIKEIEQKGIDEYRTNLRDEIYSEAYENAKHDLSIKTKINNRFGKYKIYRIIKYVIKHPFFLFSRNFYKKIKKKIDKQNYSILIVDDVFPSELSPFRFEEYMGYFDEFDSVYALSTGTSLAALNEKRKINVIISEFEEKYVQHQGRVNKYSENNLQAIVKEKNVIAVATFLQNLINPKKNMIEVFEKYNIPFIFTLYPGGGLCIGDDEVDKKLRRTFASKCFRKVIVTQKNTYDYLLKKNLCPKENIEYIYGIVTPREIFRNIDKRYYKFGKEYMDICFVAHKYSAHGEDKGYDIFIDAAKIMAKKYDDIRFHVVGGFDENVIDVSEIKDRITFYGIQKSEDLREIYSNMDIIISPNRPNVLKNGAFDGFPTGSCTEAMINGVMLICTDELKLNQKYTDNKEIIIVRPNVDEVVKNIEVLHDNPKKMVKIAQNGMKKSRNIYSYKNQMKKRISLIKSEAKKIYK